MSCFNIISRDVKLKIFNLFDISTLKLICLINKEFYNLCKIILNNKAFYHINIYKINPNARYIYGIENLKHLSILNNDKIEKIRFDDEFNEPIDILKFFTKLNLIKFGFYFDQPINNLPKSIQTIILGWKFNNKIDNLPDSLMFLELGREYNKTIEKLPINLIHLELSPYSNIFLTKIPNHFIEIYHGYDRIDQNLQYKFQNNILKQLTSVNNYRCIRYQINFKNGYNYISDIINKYNTFTIKLSTDFIQYIKPLDSRMNTNILITLKICKYIFDNNFKAKIMIFNPYFNSKANGSLYRLLELNIKVKQYNNNLGEYEIKTNNGGRIITYTDEKYMRGAGGDYIIFWGPNIKVLYDILIPIMSLKNFKSLYYLSEEKTEAIKKMLKLNDEEK